MNYKIVYLFLFIVLLSCEKQIEYNNGLKNDLFGTWTLVSQCGANKGDCIYAETDGISQDISFSEDSVFILYKQGQAAFRTGYMYKISFVYDSIKENYFLVKEIRYDSLFPDQNYEIKKQDTLILYDKCIDCNISVYKRIK